MIDSLIVVIAGSLSRLVKRPPGGEIYRKSPASGGKRGEAMRAANVEEVDGLEGSSPAGMLRQDG
ncbi:hypothetical protein [Sphingomonas sp. 1P08PE]|uniref:hypothetical protein n=1 Tax=Sphingomonas sp. 1P08PE TaxID=554122 RepID=UPI0039A1B630